MTSDYFLLDTDSTADRDGLRHLRLSQRWNTPLGRPNGGYILAAMLRGLGEELSAGEPVSASIDFLAAPTDGDAALLTRRLRLGRRISTGRAELRQGDRLIADLTANFAADEARRGRSTELGTPPNLPEPSECADPRSFMRAAGITGGIADRIEYRLAATPGWANGSPSGDPTAQLWQRVAGVSHMDRIAMALLTDAYAPAVMELGETTSVTVHLSVHLYRRPSPGWIATKLTTRHLIDGFHEEDCELWDEAGSLVAQSRQLALLA